MTGHSENCAHYTHSIPNIRVQLKHLVFTLIKASDFFVFCGERLFQKVEYQVCD